MVIVVLMSTLKLWTTKLSYDIWVSFCTQFNKQSSSSKNEPESRHLVTIPTIGWLLLHFYSMMEAGIYQPAKQLRGGAGMYTWDSYFLARNIMKSEIIMTYHSAESQRIASLVYVWYERVMRCQGGMLDGICCCTGSQSGQMSWNFCFVVAATQFWPTQSLCWRLRCNRRWGWGLMKSRMEGEEISDNGWCWLLAVARNIDHG